uniref:Uncharacterized protein n=1 Tax=Panagrolaimus sp. JU765 TaxID=591449 RepID=A0AC34RSH2_9BILA
MKDICVTRNWVNGNKTCNEFACYHDSGKHAYKFMIFYGDQQNRCIEFFENDANLTVCQCYGNDCNKPKVEEVYCRISSNSSLGSLEKCPDFTTHCRTIRDSNTNKITGRECAPVGDVSVKCEKVNGDIQACDCLGNDCNNQTSKYCFVGYGGDCNADFLKANNEPQLEECKTNEDENCYSASFNLMSRPCYIYSCDLFENNQGITPTEWYPQNGTLGCAKKNGVIHCRHKISSERIRCYDTKASSHLKETLCLPYVEQCRTIFDENDRIIARGCGELNDDPRDHTGEEIVECSGNLCNGAITCYSSKLKSMTLCDFGTLNCYAQIGKLHSMAFSELLPNPQNFQITASSLELKEDVEHKPKD